MDPQLLELKNNYSSNRPSSAPICSFQPSTETSMKNNSETNISKIEDEVEDAEFKNFVATTDAPTHVNLRPKVNLDSSKLDLYDYTEPVAKKTKSKGKPGQVGGNSQRTTKSRSQTAGHAPLEKYHGKRKGQTNADTGSGEFRWAEKLSNSLYSRNQQQTFGNYLMGPKIGKGRFSVVRFATHTITGESVAIKVVPKKDLKTEDIKILMRETQILKLIDHPHIIKLYEVVDTPEAFCLILEYIDGKCISDILPTLPTGKRGEPRIRMIMQQLSSAIAYLHSKNICHRDIKPDNIMVNSCNNVKLADFGFSNMSFNPLETHCGTPHYASPELFRKPAYDGPPVDIWALGVLLYQLYVGRMPFYGNSLRENISRGKFSAAPISGSLKHLITSMLTVNVEKRFTGQQVISHRWMTKTDKNITAVPLSLKSTEPQKDVKKDVISLMEFMGYTSTEITNSLSNHSYDQVAATYYLLRDSPRLGKYRMQMLMKPEASRNTSMHHLIEAGGNPSEKDVNFRPSNNRHNELVSDDFIYSDALFLSDCSTGENNNNNNYNSNNNSRYVNGNGSDNSNKVQDSKKNYNAPKPLISQKLYPTPPPKSFDKFNEIVNQDNFTELPSPIQSNRFKIIRDASNSKKKYNNASYLSLANLKKKAENSQANPRLVLK